MINKILEELNFPQNARQIFIQLAENGFYTARQLSESLGLPRATVYDNLKILAQNGLVTEKDRDSKRLFGIDDPKNIELLLESKMEKISSAKKEIRKWSSTLKTDLAYEPKIKFYSGVEGIKQVLKDLLWCENIETLTMWPINEMVDILGKEYLEELNRRRIKHRISIRGIWPSDKIVNFKDHPYLGVGKGHLRQLRLAPKGMTWDMSYWLYEDKVAFISSKAEDFGFVIHSRDFANLIKTQFEVIWKISKPIKAKPEYTNKFLARL